nr:ABC transporter transmembrane domain-containing protein [Alkalilimnicola ehrlichii]
MQAPPRQALQPLLRYIQPHRGLLVLAIVALLTAAAATLALPVAFRLVIDSGLTAAHAGNIDRYFIGLFGIAVVLALATALRFYCVSLFGERVVADIRQAVYSHLLKLDVVSSKPPVPASCCRA